MKQYAAAYINIDIVGNEQPGYDVHDTDGFKHYGKEHGFNAETKRTLCGEGNPQVSRNLFRTDGEFACLQCKAEANKLSD